MESKQQVINRKHTCTEPGPSFSPRLVYLIIPSSCTRCTGLHKKEDKRKAEKRYYKESKHIKHKAFYRETVQINSELLPQSDKRRLRGTKLVAALHLALLWCLHSCASS